ncbi:porin [Proteobacteria bacterium 005FR1]|nr:porin [Proteobacteria bacterium 005FR1]
MGVLGLTGALPLTALAQTTPSVEEMWRIIQKQQEEIRELKSELDEAETKIEETDVKVTATADTVEQVISVESAQGRDTVIGGYGELHYNNLDNDLAGGDDKDMIDLHRFVIFLNHSFTDDVRFFSELEVEHSLAGDGKPGEVEVEQAYLEWDFAESHRAKAGLFLVPVGILNETHEPDTFFGVERNNVESKIIPSTWWEGGLGTSGELAPGWGYDLAFHSGLYMKDGKVGNVRSARQKVAEAKADDYATTGRIRYTGLPGLEVGLTLQLQNDVLQGENIQGVSSIEGLLLETHVAYQNGPFLLRALYAQWDFDDEIEELTPGADKQKGWYVEPGYRISPQWGVFARYSLWDTEAGGNGDSEYNETNVGVNYWLTENAVLKADYQVQDAPSGASEFDGFNLGVGWSF